MAAARAALRVAVALALCGAALAAWAQRSTPELEAAFRADGFTVDGGAQLNGFRGLRAHSDNVTLYGTATAKRVFYVEGGAYEMGYLLGELAAEETLLMCSVYLEHIVPSLVDESLDDLLSKNLTRPAYEYLLRLITDLLVRDSIDSFLDQYGKGIFPSSVVDEMHGLVDGVAAVTAPSSGAAVVTFERLVALNYGLDFLFAEIFSGHILEIIVGRAEAYGVPADVRAALARLDVSIFQLPQYCDAFAVRNAYTRSGNGSFFARDFQMQNGLVYNLINTMTIYNPLGDDDAVPLISAHAPGMVGSVAAMNADGVAMGVDVLRNSFVNHSLPGLNSLMMVRVAVQNSRTSADVLAYVRGAVRGVSWLYPVSDAAGNGVMLEVGRSQHSAPGAGVPSMLDIVDLKHVAAHLPDAAFLSAHSQPDYADGVFARHIDYEFPLEFLRFNRDLFAASGVAYNDSAAAWAALGYVYGSFAEENALWKKIASCFFSPQRESDPDVVLVSNMALTPQMRIAQMTRWAALVPGEAMQWRYDALWETVAARRGQFDLETTKDAILFLAPERTPGYWTHRLDPDDPQSTLVEGSIHAMDLQAKIMCTKSGYFGDGWLQLTLPNYV